MLTVVDVVQRTVNETKYFGILKFASFKMLNEMM